MLSIFYFLIFFCILIVHFYYLFYAFRPSPSFSRRYRFYLVHTFFFFVVEVSSRSVVIYIFSVYSSIDHYQVSPSTSFPSRRRHVFTLYSHYFLFPSKSLPIFLFTIFFSSHRVFFRRSVARFINFSQGRVFHRRYTSTYLNYLIRSLKISFFCRLPDIL